MRTYIILLFLSTMASCHSSRKTAVENISENRKIELEKISTRKVDIPASNVSMKIPAINGVINETPPGSSYNARKGNASVSVRFIRDTLFVEANCDSLSQIIWEYERKIGEIFSSFPLFSSIPAQMDGKYRIMHSHFRFCQNRYI